ncbi:MAG: hemerythrin family protein [Candidatus Korobacteraceae bacterium]
MPWKDSNKLGISVIDKQHRELYKMLNELNQAMAEGRGKNLAADLMRRLTPLICEHFDAEEKALQQRQSPAYRGCCAKHAEQLAVLQSFLRDKNASDPSAVIDLLYFLDSLLDGHIDSERQALGLHDGELIQ